MQVRVDLGIRFFFSVHVEYTDQSVKARKSEREGSMPILMLQWGNVHQINSKSYILSQALCSLSHPRVQNVHVLFAIIYAVTIGFIVTQREISLFSLIVTRVQSDSESY